MFNVLLVDDEVPALNYLEAIIKQFLPDFRVAARAENAMDALDILTKEPMDVLVADINMPGSMNGISLVTQARQQYPGLHILIVSGYAEFEYARGAMLAGVEEYLLKPVSIDSLRKVMEKMLISLEEERAARRNQAIADLIAKGNDEGGQAAAVFGRERFFFAVARLGNLNRYGKMRNVDPYPLNDPAWRAFCGHDEKELILLRPAGEATPHVAQELQDLLARNASDTFWTVAYDPEKKPLRMLPAFLQKAFRLIQRVTIIGVSQCLPVSTSVAEGLHTLPTATRRTLESFLTSGAMQRVKELFLSLAIEWENQKIPQIHVQDLCFQLVNTIASANGYHKPKQQEDQDAELWALFANATSLGELMAGLYELVFDESSAHDRHTSSSELCDFALAYIREHYAEPLNIQQVCAKIGISQTYLSRLLRKNANTTVNTYLTQCRIEAAKKLFEQYPDMLLKDVSSCVGYDDQSYFNKIFRAETGMTPKQYAALQEKK